MRIVLDVVAGPDAGKSFVYGGLQSLVVGRAGSPDANSRLPSDPYMSRHHFLLVVAGSSCVVYDLSASNGVYVNGERVAQRKLRDGDLIGAGHTKIRLHTIFAGEEASGGREKSDATDGARRVLAEFELKEKIGAGEFAEVYRATDTRTGETVAIKTVPLDPEDRDDAVDHFVREISICERLHHPHVVRTLAAGRDRERLWLAMEFVTGPTLRRLVDDTGPVTEQEGLRMLRELLAAVHYAHGHGVIHRDIKPENVLLDDREGKLAVRLADFGLAKCFWDPGAPSLTTSGNMKGTPRYMPREQILETKHVGPRSDLFSVAATLYNALTADWHYDAGGRNPWAAILDARNIPIRERRPDLGARLADVLDKALAPEPQDRPASAAAMLAQLDES